MKHLWMAALMLAACVEIEEKNHFEILDSLLTPVDPAAQFLRDLIFQPKIKRASAS